jgi:uncharacterized protein (DUF433 family)
MQTAQKSYVRYDDHGAMRVGETQVMLDSVVVAFEQGHSPETIAQQYLSLTLEEVYGAVAYYLANKAEINQYLQQQSEVWKTWREKASAAESPVVQRLRQIAKRGTDSK